MHDKGKGFVPDQLAPHADYILYGEAPGKNEIAEGKPFVGMAGFVLKNWLVRAVPQIQLAWERKKVSLMNTLRCLPPEVQGRAYPKGQERVDAERCCTQYRDMGTAQTVILFGDSPQRYFFKDELDAEDAVDRQLGHDSKGVMGRIGRVYERDGKRFVFAPHPAFVLRQPALVQHGQQALAIATNTEHTVAVDYMAWDRAMAELQ